MRRHDRAVVEHGAEEHLDTRAGRVVERDDLLGVPVVGLFEGELLDGDAGLLHGLTDALQREVVAHLQPTA